MRRFMKRPTNEQGCARVAEGGSDVCLRFKVEAQSLRGCGVVHAGGVCVVAGDDRQAKMFDCQQG